MKLLVLDGNSILNRAFYGIKLLTTKDGHYTNAIYGFLTTFRRLLDESSPDAVAVAFDLKAPTFRHKAYGGYKANRKGMPQELAEQLAPLKEIIAALGYKIVTCEGYEADDILGTLAKKCTDEGYECVIATGDRDSLQLVSPTVSVRIAATKFGKPEVTLYDEEKIREVYGVTPKQLIDIKAIQGDTSDCIPGVPGIGQKGAAELISKFGSVDNIYENIDTLDIKPGMKNKLIAGKDSAYMSLMLGTICTEAPINTDIDGYIPAQRNKSQTAALLAQYELFSLMEKWGVSGEDIAKTLSEESSEQDSRVLQVKEADHLLELYEQLKGKRVDFIASGDGDDITEISLCADDIIYSANAFNAEFRVFVEKLLSDESIQKRTHDIKPIFAAAEKAGFECRSIIFDTMLAAYLLNPNSPDYQLERLVSEYNITPLKSDKASVLESFIPLADKLSAEIDAKELTKLLHDIELPLAKVLASMENTGFAVDRQGIYDYGESMNADIERLRNSIYEQVGYEFNINSPKQLGSALFEKLALPKGKKTKSGYSTSAEVLEELKNYHPVINDILEYRTLTKLKSTYCDGLLKVIGADGRIHSSFNQTETRTGRISSTEPNLQNIPVRTERGKEFRRFFRAADGCLLADADYSQIELRVLAHIAADKQMIEAFENHYDIHTSTAAKVFGLPDDMVTPALRSRAKAVNFGIVYGIGAFSLAKDIGVTRKEADKYIKDYLKLYSGIDSYMNSIVEKAKSDGYVTTMFGRRRYLPELASSNHNIRAFGERVARNMPIQGTAADIIKIAMIKVYDRLKKENMKSRLILQVHDELIVEAPEDEAGKAAAILSEEMQNAVELSVALTADAGVGKTWYEAKT
ncbi:MAG: DNA polymerase I [Clostridia bacterium]|nr:DNA polymerase I [Clostridia bacterium]